MLVCEVAGHAVHSGGCGRGSSMLHVCGAKGNNFSFCGCASTWQTLDAKQCSGCPLVSAPGVQLDACCATASF